METLKIGFFILGSAASLGFIIFFLCLIFNKDNGIDLEQGRINYLSLEVERLDKKISKKVENEKCPWDFYHLDFVKEARLEENKRLENEVKKLRVEVEEYSKAINYWKKQYDLISDKFSNHTDNIVGIVEAARRQAESALKKSSISAVINDDATLITGENESEIILKLCTELNSLKNFKKGIIKDLEFYSLNFQNVADSKITFNEARRIFNNFIMSLKEKSANNQDVTINTNRNVE